MVNHAPQLDQVFRALADPTRRAMLRALAAGEHTVTELASPFRMSLPGASKHVRVLERAGLVRRTVAGRTHTVRLEVGPLAEAQRWLRQYERFWSGRTRGGPALAAPVRALLERSPRRARARASASLVQPTSTEEAVTDHGTITEGGTVRFERLLPGPITRVWEYLTDPHKRGLWLASGPMELRPGGRVELQFHHSELSPQKEEVPERYRQYEGSVVHGQVVRSEPPHLLTYTWGETNGRESQVTFQLAEEGSNVRLVLTHRRLAEGDETLGVASGWHTHLGVLVERLAGRAPAPFWSAHARHEAAYARLLDSR